MIDRSVAPKFVPIKDVHLQEVVSQELHNGIKLHAISAGNQPVINLQLIFKAGKWYEEKPGTAFLLSKLMLEGTKSYSAKQINNFFDSHGIFWEISSGFDHLTIDIYLLSKYLHKISDILISILSEAILPESEFASIKKRVKQQMSVNFIKTAYVANVNFRDKLFGEEHPYGYKLSASMLESVQYQDIVAYYNSHVRQKSFEVVASGLIDSDLFYRMMAEFEVMDADLFTAQPLQAKVKSSFGVYHEDWKESLQTSIRIGQAAPNKNSKDATCFELLNRILGGYFGSRLMRNLREEKGITYGIQSSTVYLVKHAYNIIATDVVKDKKDFAIEEIYKEIKHLTTHRVPEDELAVVKNYVVGSFIKSINSPFSLSQYFKTVYFHNLNKDYFNNYVSEIHKVSTDDILATAKKYFNREYLEIAIG